MGIFNWLFGKKTTSESKKKTTSKVKEENDEQDKTTVLLKKFHLLYMDVQNNKSECLDVLNEVIPLVEIKQLPLFEAAERVKTTQDLKTNIKAISQISFTDLDFSYKFTYSELLYYRGSLKAEKGDVSAIEDFEKSIEINEDENALINLSLAYINIAQDIAKSMECIKKCTDLFPESRRAKEVMLKILTAVNKSIGGD
jgi:tetratricopeptide (TPR) repeat protein